MNEHRDPFRSDEFLRLLRIDLRTALIEWGRVSEGKRLGPFCILFTHFLSPQSLYLAACSLPAFEALIEKWNGRVGLSEDRRWTALSMLHSPADWKEMPACDLECTKLITPGNPSEEVLATLHTLCEQALAEMDEEGLFGAGAVRDSVTLAVVAPNDNEALGLGSVIRLNPQVVADRYAMPGGL